MERETRFELATSCLEGVKYETEQMWHPFTSAYLLVPLAPFHKYCIICSLAVQPISDTRKLYSCTFHHRLSGL